MDWQEVVPTECVAILAVDLVRQSGVGVTKNLKIWQTAFDAGSGGLKLLDLAPQRAAASGAEVGG
jgi:hypothetical protein